MAPDRRIAAGTLVCLAYELRDAEGRLVEGGEEPIRFVQGEESVLPAIEKAVEGLAVGAEVTLTLEPEDAYGPYDPAGIVSVPRAELPPEPLPTPGDWISVTVEHDSHETDELEMRVVEVDEDEVLLDANHPLAGQRVTFALRVLELADAPPPGAAEAEAAERAEAPERD